MTTMCTSSTCSRSHAALARLAFAAMGYYLLSGCVYGLDRTPNLVATTRPPELAPPLPRIKFLQQPSLVTWTTVNGVKTDLDRTEFVEALGRVQSDTAFLSESGEGIEEPEFVLELDTEIAHEAANSNWLAGITLTIFPAYDKTRASCRATLTTPEGEVLSTFTAMGEKRVVVQILLWPLLPYAIATEDDLYDDTVGDIMIQLGLYLREHPKQLQSGNP